MVSTNVRNKVSVKELFSACVVCQDWMCEAGPIGTLEVTFVNVVVPFYMLDFALIASTWRKVESWCIWIFDSKATNHTCAWSTVHSCVWWWTIFPCFTLHPIILVCLSALHFGKWYPDTNLPRALSRFNSHGHIVIPRTRVTCGDRRHWRHCVLS